MLHLTTSNGAPTPVALTRRTPVCQDKCAFSFALNDDTVNVII